MKELEAELADRDQHLEEARQLRQCAVKRERELERRVKTEEEGRIHAERRMKEEEEGRIHAERELEKLQRGKRGAPTQSASPPPKRAALNAVKREFGGKAKEVPVKSEEAAGKSKEAGSKVNDYVEDEFGNVVEVSDDETL